MVAAAAVLIGCRTRTHTHVLTVAPFLTSPLCFVEGRCLCLSTVQFCCRVCPSPCVQFSQLPPLELTCGPTILAAHSPCVFFSAKMKICEWFHEWTGQIVKEQEEEHSEMTDLRWRLSCCSSCYSSCSVATQWQLKLSGSVADQPASWPV